MAYTGQVPWHRIGQRLPEGLVIQDLMPWAKTQETMPQWAMKLYKVEASYRGKQEYYDVPSQRAVVRADNTWMGYVGDKYTLIGPEEHFNNLTQLTHGLDAKVSAVGTLDNGRRLIVTLQLDEQQIIGDDCIQPFMMLSDGYAANAKLRTGRGSIRGVCRNTEAAFIWDMKTGKAKTYITEKHTRHARRRVSEKLKGISQLLKDNDTMTEMYRAMARKPLTSAMWEDYLDLTGFELPEERGRQYTTRLNAREVLSQIRETQECNDSLWGAYNAITEYTSHHVTVRGTKNPAARRLGNILSGKATLQQKGLRAAPALMDIKSESLIRVR